MKHESANANLVNFNELERNMSTKMRTVLVIACFALLAALPAQWLIAKKISAKQNECGNAGFNFVWDVGADSDYVGLKCR